AAVREAARQPARRGLRDRDRWLTGGVPDEVRRAAVPWLLRRGRRGGGGAEGRRRRADLAWRSRSRRSRGDHRSWWLLLRRLPQGGRDRAVLAGHGVGDRVRARRRPGARHLQR